MPRLTQREGSPNYYVRYAPPPAARPAFGGSSDVWKSTGTGDKKEAERIGRRILVELENISEECIREFTPWATTRLLTLNAHDAEQFALELATGKTWRDFQANKIKDADALSLRFRAAGLPLPPAAERIRIQAETALAAYPVSLVPTTAQSPTAASNTPAASIKAEPVGIPVEQIEPIFQFCIEKRKTSLRTSKSQMRECGNLVAWMGTEGHDVLTRDVAFDYVEYLQEDVLLNTAKSKFSMVTFPFEVALAARKVDGHTVDINPFADCKIISAAGESSEIRREAITPKDYQAIVSALPSASEYPLLHWSVKIAAVTGIRVAAFTGLLFGEVIKQGGVVCVKVAKRSGNKNLRGGMEYWIPVHNSVAHEFWDWVQSQNGEEGERIFTKKDASWDFSKLLAEIGVKPEDPAKMKTFHSLRHSTATWLKEQLTTPQANAMQGRQEGGTLGQYGSPAGVLTYADKIINAPLWWHDDYIEQIRAKQLKESKLN